MKNIEKALLRNFHFAELLHRLTDRVEKPPTWHLVENIFQQVLPGKLHGTLNICKIKIRRN